MRSTREKFEWLIILVILGLVVFGLYIVNILNAVGLTQLLTEIKQPVATLLTGILAVGAVILAQWQFAVRQRKDHLELRDRQALDHDKELQKQRAEHQNDLENRIHEKKLAKKEELIEKLNSIQFNIAVFKADYSDDICSSLVTTNHEKFQESISSCARLRKAIVLELSLVNELLLIYFPDTRSPEVCSQARDKFTTTNTLFLKQVNELSTNYYKFYNTVSYHLIPKISDSESTQFKNSIDEISLLLSELSKYIRNIENKFIKS